MTFEQFVEHVKTHDVPAQDMSPALASLWHAEKGHWDTAHEMAQDIDSADGSWIHANLHREEGDQGNAEYWYRRAAQAVPSNTFTEERQDLIRHFLTV